MAFLRRGTRIWFDSNPNATPETGKFSTDLGIDESEQGILIVSTQAENIPDDILRLYFRNIMDGGTNVQWQFDKNCSFSLQFYTRLHVILFTLDPEPSYMSFCSPFVSSSLG